MNNGSRCPSSVSISIENSAIYLKEQLERYKDAIGESLFADVAQKRLPLLNSKEKENIKKDTSQLYAPFN